MCGSGLETAWTGTAQPVISGEGLWEDWQEQQVMASSSVVPQNNVTSSCHWLTLSRVSLAHITRVSLAHIVMYVSLAHIVTCVIGPHCHVRHWLTSCVCHWLTSCVSEFCLICLFVLLALSLLPHRAFPLLLLSPQPT